MYVQSLKVENIKAFDNLSLDFRRPDSADTDPFAGLNFFVGGNASGKSTLLKCIAMALSGPTTASQQLVSPVGWIRQGVSKGTIDLMVHHSSRYDQFRTGGAPLAAEGFRLGLIFEADESDLTPAIKAREFRFRNTRVKTAERGPWHPDAPGWFLGAYGPFRRLTGSSTDALRYALAQGKLSSCVTLFHEDAALSESETWLKHEYSRSLQRKDLGQAPSPLVDQVKELLNDGLLPEGFKITRITVDEVFMSTPNGGELPLRDLSDGLRSVYALLLDIMHSMSSAYGVESVLARDANGRLIVDRPGVVLIDELEAHLHPSWQQTICEWLKKRFPQVQFFIATHSPIILQAADSGGIFVLPMPQEQAQGRQARRLNPHEQERIVLGRAEKVLLGEAFGLKRTWSARAEKLVERWERLSALKEARGQLPPADQNELAELDREMEMVFDAPLEALHA